MFKVNSFWFGLLLGILFPAVLFGFLTGVNYFTHIFDHPPVQLTIQKMMFVSAALNIIPIRFYFKSPGIEKTGQGLLAVTVFLVFMIFLSF